MCRPAFCLRVNLQGKRTIYRFPSLEKLLRGMPAYRHYLIHYVMDNFTILWKLALQDPTAFTGLTTPGREVWWNVRLPRNVTPKHYDLTIFVDLSNFKFNGHVSILITVTEPTQYVLLHTNRLKITSVTAQTVSEGKY